MMLDRYHQIRKPQIGCVLPKFTDKFKPRSTLKLVGGSFSIPKKNTARPQGEDAHFICESRNAIGIADGVGGWACEGVDSGKFSRELMANCESLFNQSKIPINPGRVMELAYRKTRSVGSSTACIIVLKDNNALRFANLGDSGFILIREKKVLYESPVQLHGFNFPYQLGSGSKDTPNLACEEEIRVKDGDIVIAGTDGLFDNVYPSEEEDDDDDLDKLAREIAECAWRNSMDKSYFSPFAKAAQTEGKKYNGGKYDDITVVVAKIKKDTTSPP